MGLAVIVLWWRWPTAEVTGWSKWFAILFALGQASAAAVAAWLVILPLLLSLAMEDLVRKVQRQAGVEPMELPLMSSLLATLRMMLNTLPLRLGWAGAGIILGIFLGPVGAVVGAIGMGQIACLDALDLGLSLRGLDGLSRLAALKAHKSERLQAGLLAGLSNLVFAATFILWPLWLPGLVTGAAKRVLEWPEARRLG